MKTANETLSVTTPTDRTIVLTRTFNAPAAIVFAAWTNPEHVKRWWAIRNHSLVVCEIDLRPGGSWRYVLRAAGGMEMTFRGDYREIDPPTRLVYTERFVAPDFESPESLNTVTFEERQGKTTMISTVLHASKEARDGHLRSGMEDGSRECLDQLAEHLLTMV